MMSAFRHSTPRKAEGFGCPTPHPMPSGGNAAVMRDKR